MTDHKVKNTYNFWYIRVTVSRTTLVIQLKSSHVFCLKLLQKNYQLKPVQWSFYVLFLQTASRIYIMFNKNTLTLKLQIKECPWHYIKKLTCTGGLLRIQLNSFVLTSLEESSYLHRFIVRSGQRQSTVLCLDLFIMW